MTSLLRVPFFEDEIFTSYISRTARANGFKTSRLFAEMLGLIYDRLLVGDSAELAAFCDCMKLPSNFLAERAHALDMGHDVSPTERAYQRKLISKRKFRYCPKCLAEDQDKNDRMPGTRRYRRKAWIYRAVKSCAHHMCALVEPDLTLNTRNRDDFSFFLDGLIAAGELETETSAYKSGPLEAFIYERSAGKRNHGELLDALSLPLAIDMSLILGTALQFGKERASASLSEEEEKLAENRGFAALQNGETGFISALDEITHDTVLRHFRVSGEAIYKNFYRTLAHQRFSSEYDGFRDRVRAHAIMRFPLVDGADVFGPINDSPWTSAKQIAEDLGKTCGPVYKAAEKLNLVLDASFPKEIGQQIREYLEDKNRQRYTQSEAAKAVGCAIGHFRAIEAHGLLGPTSGGSLFDAPLKAGTEALLAAIDSAVNCDVQPGMISALKYAATGSMTVTELLALIIAGKFEHVARSDAPRLFDSLMLFKASTEPCPSGHVAHGKAAKLLRVPPNSIARFIDEGILESHTRMIPVTEINRFRGEFISLSELRIVSGQPNRIISAHARRLAVRYAFEEKELFCRLFHRRDASKIEASLGITIS